MMKAHISRVDRYFKSGSAARLCRDGIIIPLIKSSPACFRIFGILGGDTLFFVHIHLWHHDRKFLCSLLSAFRLCLDDEFSSRDGIGANGELYLFSCFFL